MQTAMKKIRLGMIGGGEGAFIGAVHRRAAALDGRYELVGGSFSRDEGNNARTAASLGLTAERCYSNWEQLIDAESQLDPASRMEALVICTPNHLHACIAEAALRADFHVMSEKPAAISLAEAVALEAAVQKASRHYALAHTYVGYPLVWQARAMVSQGALGRLRKIFVEYPQGWMSGPEESTGNKQASWRTNPALAGPSACMGDIGTHAFNLAEFVSGQQISKVCTDLHSHIEGRQLDDDGAALFRTDGGVSGVLIASQVCAGIENDLKIRLYGEHGGLEWRQAEPNTLVHSLPDRPAQILRAGADHGYLHGDALQRVRLPGGHPEGYIEAMANIYSDFARLIRGDAAQAWVPGIREGVRGLAFIEAMLASSQNNSAWTAIADPASVSKASVSKE